MSAIKNLSRFISEREKETWKLTKKKEANRY
jgi:hypothetical protein